MTEFLRENVLFIASLIFLAVLIAGASTLQTAHGTAGTMHGSTATSQTISSAADNGAGWHVVTSTASAPAKTATPATAISPTPAVSPITPTTQRRLYNEGQDDDN